jgi:hypothetical protein
MAIKGDSGTPIWLGAYLFAFLIYSLCFICVTSVSRFHSYHGLWKFVDRPMAAGDLNRNRA